MSERRARTRDRVIYGAVIASIDGRPVSVPCVVRNFSDRGASVRIAAPHVIPDRITLTIASKSRSFHGSIAWRRADAIGIAFDPDADPPALAPELASDLASQLRRSEKKERQLRRRIRELLGQS